MSCKVIKPNAFLMNYSKKKLMMVYLESLVFTLGIFMMDQIRYFYHSNIKVLNNIHTYILNIDFIM